MVLYYGPLLCFSKCLKYQMTASLSFLLWSFIMVLYYCPLLSYFTIFLYYGPLLSSFITCINLYYRPLLSWLFSYLNHEVVVSSLSSIMTYCSPLLWSFTMVLYYGPS